MFLVSEILFLNLRMFALFTIPSETTGVISRFHKSQSTWSQLSENNNYWIVLSNEQLCEGVRQRWHLCTDDWQGNNFHQEMMRHPMDLQASATSTALPRQQSLLVLKQWSSHCIDLSPWPKSAWWINITKSNGFMTKTHQPLRIWCQRSISALVEVIPLLFPDTAICLAHQCLGTWGDCDSKSLPASGLVIPILNQFCSSVCQACLHKWVIPHSTFRLAFFMDLL